MFGNIRDEVINKFKTGVEQYTAVSGFIFLRFFCPAILNPMLFGLVDGKELHLECLVLHVYFSFLFFD